MIVKRYSKKFKQNKFSSRNVTVKRGSLPLIISSGHGGRDRLSTIPDRKQEGSVLLSDMYTAEIAEGIEKGIQDHYKNAPHLIINLISRRKLDVNRKIEEGAEVKRGELVWNEYHDFLQDAVDCLLKDYDYGLMIDIHGIVE
jgi:N-formylglutamate amidohydrolase